MAIVTGPTSDASDTATVRMQVRDGIAWLTLNRPEVANARNQDMRRELVALYADISAREDVRVVVLTGAGDRHFCAGMDLNEASGPASPLDRRLRLQGGKDIDALASLPQPTIASINGTALGGGLEMALACDLRIASSLAVLGLPEVGLGLLPGGGGTQRLQRLVGIGKATEMILLGRRIDGVQAAAIGLVNEHVPPDGVSARASELAGELAAQPMTALRLAKEALGAGLRSPWNAAIQQESELLNLLIDDRQKVQE